MANIVLTGGCGFIGANLIPMLRAAGHGVTVLDNLSRGRLEFIADTDVNEVIEADIRDGDKVLEAVSGKDAVIHLAAYGSVVESVANPGENFSVNVEGTFNVLEAARRVGIDQVIFASTGGALIGDAPLPVNEKSVPRPLSPYGASKLAGEGYCCAFANAYGMSITALRFANVVGPVSWHKKGAVTAFMKCILNDEPIRIYGDGTATRDFLYVTDLCRGILAALDAVKPGFNVYHLAGGREVSINELADLIRETASAPDHPVIYEDRRRGEVERNFGSYDLAEAELGFRPRVPLEEALRYTWDWMREYQ